MKNFGVALTICSLMFTQSACSVYQALSQPPPADLAGIGPGTPRYELIFKFGPPQNSDFDSQGRKQEYFEFQSGLHQAFKLRVILYLAADIFTIALAELILWPMERTVLERATCIGLATYDQDQKIETWKVGTRSGGVQGC